MPQGGIDENEDPRNAAIRELKEETGVTSAELLLSGNEEEINLLGDGTEKPEFGQWSWMAPQQTIDLAVDFKKSVYQEVFTVFSVHLQ